MSGLFIELYLDEDVHVVIADLLRGRGFSATTAREEGQLARSDEEQLAYAVSQRKTLLTHNRRDLKPLPKSMPVWGKRITASFWQCVIHLMNGTAVDAFLKPCDGR